MRDDGGDEEDRVSLGRLDPVEALKALLAVDPDAPGGKHGEAKQPSPKPAEPDDE